MVEALRFSGGRRKDVVEVLDIVVTGLMFVFVLTIIFKSWAKPTAPRAGHSRDPEVAVDRPIEGARVMIWGPALFVAIFAVFVAIRMAYEEVQEFPDFLAYGLLLCAGIELVLYLCVTRVFVGSVLETVIRRSEGTYSEELEAFYAREYQRFSRIPLVLAGIFAPAGVLLLLWSVLA